MTIPQPLTLGEAVRRWGGRTEGDPAFVARRLAPLDEAGPDDLTFCLGPRCAAALRASRAGAAIVPESLAEGFAGPRWIVADAHLAFARIMRALHPAPAVEHSISPHALIDPTATVAAPAEIGPFVVIGAGVVVGPGARIGAHVVVGAGARVGADVLMRSHVSVGEGCRLGDRVVLREGCRVGAEGFGYARDEAGRWLAIPQAGVVELGDDVEVGANVCIDRSTLGVTRVSDGTKIDNLVQIGHNVVVGRDCLLVAQAGLAGSVRVGDGAVLAGQAGVADHRTIGAGAVVGAQAGVTRDVAPGAVVSGYPARPHATAKAIEAALEEWARRRMEAASDPSGKVRHDGED